MTKTLTLVPKLRFVAMTLEGEVYFVKDNFNDVVIANGMSEGWARQVADALNLSYIKDQ